MLYLSLLPLFLCCICVHTTSIPMLYLCPFYLYSYVVSVSLLPLFLCCICVPTTSIPMLYLCPYYLYSYGRPHQHSFPIFPNPLAQLMLFLVLSNIKGIFVTLFLPLPLSCRCSLHPYSSMLPSSLMSYFQFYVLVPPQLFSLPSSVSERNYICLYLTQTIVCCR